MGATQSTDKRKAMADRNAETILEAAESLLHAGRSATISAVAKQSGLSRVTVYAHFPDRQALVETVVKRAVEHVMAALGDARPDDGPALDALRRLIGASWQQLAANQGIARAAAGELSADAMRRTHESARRVLADLIERGRADGSFRTDVPTEWLITSFLALIHAAADEARAGAVTNEQACELLTVTVCDVFIGVR